MSEKELVEKKFGEAKLDLKITDAKKLRLEIGFDGSGADAGAFVELAPDYFLDKLKKAIPGEIDDTVIELLKAAFLK